MEELDAADILSIPRKIESQEVVRRGFLSNFLFQNISNVFGAKVYEQFAQDVRLQVDSLAEGGTYEVDRQVEAQVDTVKDSIKENVLVFVISEYEVKKGVQNRLEKLVNREIERSFEEIQGDHKQQAAIAKAEFEQKQKEAESEQEVKRAEQELRKEISAFCVMVGSMKIRKVERRNTLKIICLMK